MIHGKDIIIMMDGVAIAACKSNDLSISTDMVEVASTLSGSDKQYIAGRSSWSASGNVLVTNLPYLMAMKGKAVSVAVKSPGTILTGLTIENGDYTGNAIVKDIKISASKNSLATGSIQLQGSGPLTKVANYTLVDACTYTVFCPENREATEKTFSSQETFTMADFTVAGQEEVAVICNGSFTKGSSTISAIASSFKFYNRTGTYYDATLGAYITRSNCGTGFYYPMYVDWAIDGINGTYQSVPKMKFV